MSAWGDDAQADLARLRALVVGVGSVGLDVALRLVATGIEHVGVMDFDVVEPKNLDRQIGATRVDAALRRRKTAVAERLLRQAATAAAPEITRHDLSICEPDGLRAALDYDVIFSCVDRPWPRAVLNVLAYSDLIPVIDGGIAIDAFPDGVMRNATVRTHVIRPGRPCLSCNGQLDGAAVARDMAGLLDDPTYIAGLDRARRGGENVALLSVSVTASLLTQFVSLTVSPGGRGDPGPLRFSLADHHLEHLPARLSHGCQYETATAVGEDRVDLTGRDVVADTA